jgi:hypothetical protein
MAHNYSIAYFISPHGYGHAARAAAVMAAIHQFSPAVRFEIFTQVPEWFFADSLTIPFGYHPLLTDIGLVQQNSLIEDLPGTLRRLDDFLPFAADRIEGLAGQLSQLKCNLVICDIAPLGIAVAQAAQIPSLLIENFTWDWIYQAYLPHEPQFEPHLNYLQSLFRAVDYHIQTEPICQASPAAALTTAPISRQIKIPAEQIRAQLGLSGQAKVVLLTMGGVPWNYTFLQRLEQQDGTHFVIPGGSPQPERRRNLVLLPNHTTYYHPDLINAADVVIGKVGYSTLAEVYQAGAPYGYIPRPHFRESAMLAQYVERHMSGLAIADAEFEDGRWLIRLPELLALPRLNRPTVNGAEQVARFILERVLA